MAIERKPSRKFLNVSVGQRFARRRRELGISSTVVADRLGLSLEDLKASESGKREFRAAELYTAAELFGERPDWFFQSLNIKISEWPDGQT